MIDRSKYTTEMTRAKHAVVHSAMRKEGIIVPHINTEEYNEQQRLINGGKR